MSARHASCIVGFEPRHTWDTSEAICDVVRGSARIGAAEGRPNASVRRWTLQACESTHAAARRSARTCVGEDAKVDAEVVVCADTLVSAAQRHHRDDPCARTSVTKVADASEIAASMALHRYPRPLGPHPAQRCCRQHEKAAEGRGTAPSGPAWPASSASARAHAWLSGTSKPGQPPGPVARPRLAKVTAWVRSNSAPRSCFLLASPSPSFSPPLTRRSARCSLFAA